MSVFESRFYATSLRLLGALLSDHLVRFSPSVFQVRLDFGKFFPRRSFTPSTHLAKLTPSFRISYLAILVKATNRSGSNIPPTLVLPVDFISTPTHRSPLFVSGEYSFSDFDYLLAIWRLLFCGIGLSLVVNVLRFLLLADFFVFG